MAELVWRMEKVKKARIKEMRGIVMDGFQEVLGKLNEE